jgi:hypothetical protein
MNAPPRPDALLGFRACADGFTRPVFLDSEGEQYLLHEDEGRVYGLWMNHDRGPDAPQIVPAGRREFHS